MRARVQAYEFWLIFDSEDGRLAPVSARARMLARTMFSGLLARHRWPRFGRLAMRLDERLGVGSGDAKLWLEPAAPGGIFAWWLHVKPRGGARPVLLPIRGWSRERAHGRGAGMSREGVLGRTVNLFLDDDGRLQAALTRDVTEVLEQTRAAYAPRCEVLALDFGLRHLFATSKGDLLGRNFIDRIRPWGGRTFRSPRPVIHRRPEAIAQGLDGSPDAELHAARDRPAVRRA